MKNTRVINLFGSSGSGKTTIMAGLFYKMKKARYDVEMSQEVAKNYVWEGRYEALKCQPFVSSEQLWNIDMLVGKVDYIITDSPFLLSAIYGPLYTGDKYPQSFYDGMLEYHQKIDGYNYVIERGFPYEQNGRIQDEIESKDVNNRILRLLDENNINHTILVNEDSDWVVDKIFEGVFNV